MRTEPISNNYYNRRHWFLLLRGKMLLKNKWRIILTVLLALVFAVSVGTLIKQQVDYKRGEADYAEASHLATPPQPDEENQPEEIPQEDISTPTAPRKVYTDPYAAALAETDLDSLQAVNSDVVGWISIPNTELSYPLLQGEDNDYYLTHTWQNEENSVGAIALEHRVSPDLSDFNTIVYGHRMRNGSMFGSLRNYNDINYWKQAPSVYVLIDSGEVYHYDIFAAYQADISLPVYLPGISEQSDKEDILQYALTHSVIDTGIIPTAEDQILSLITCTGEGYSARWIVQAVRVLDGG